MEILVLSEKDIAETMDLFCRSFSEDHYYAELFPNPATKAKDMAEAFQETIADCIRTGASLGVRDQKKLIGFLLCFDYNIKIFPHAFSFWKAIVSFVKEYIVC